MPNSRNSADAPAHGSVVAVIPAYVPGESFPAFVAGLFAAGFGAVVVVDDGSPATCRAFFDAVQAQGATVLVHAENRGKGAALKTAFAYVLSLPAPPPGVVTLDADGQHAVEDCRRAAEALVAHPSAAVLGARSFALGSTPFRSWWGNRWTTLMLGAASGLWLGDTQCGLRAFPLALLSALCAVPGDGYAWETAVLCELARRRIPFLPLSIQTLYAPGNATSHYDPLRDTLRVWRVLGQAARRRFAASRFVCCCALFREFAVVAAVTFGGGMAMVPPLRRACVEKRKWLTDEEMLDVVALVHSLPGLIAVNVAVLTGRRVAGVPGALAAAFGAVFVPFFVLIGVAAARAQMAASPALDAAFLGVRAGVAALVAAAVADLARNVCRSHAARWTAAAAFAACALFRFDVAGVVLFALVVGCGVAAWRKWT